MSAQPLTSPPANQTPPQSNDATSKAVYAINSDVVISPYLEGQLRVIAGAFTQSTGLRLRVTSATRTPQRQATAMFDMISMGGGKKLYRNSAAFKAIATIHSQGLQANKARLAIEAEMAAEIERQLKAGAPISWHLTGRAMDLATKGMTVDQIAVLRNICARELGTSILESSPEHLHVQFP